MKKTASLWQYRRDQPSDNTPDCKSFKLTPSIANNTNKSGIAKVKIVVPLK